MYYWHAVKSENDHARYTLSIKANRKNILIIKTDHNNVNVMSLESFFSPVVD